LIFGESAQENGFITEPSGRVLSVSETKPPRYLTIKTAMMFQNASQEAYASQG